MTTREQSQSELLSALTNLANMRPDWGMEQTLANVRAAAGRPDVQSIWELEDEEALAAARRLMSQQYAQTGLTKTLEELQEAVRQAFAEVRSPTPDRIAPCPCQECREVCENLAVDPGTHWTEIASERISAHYGKLSLLTPEAFQFYLPAFLMYALRTWRSSLVWEFAIYSLVPKESRRGTLDEWWRERFQRFTPQQLKVIAAVLDLLLADMQDWHMWTIADQGKKALDRLSTAE